MKLRSVDRSWLEAILASADVSPGEKRRAASALLASSGVPLQAISEVFGLSQLQLQEDAGALSSLGVRGFVRGDEGDPDALQQDIHGLLRTAPPAGSCRWSAWDLGRRLGITPKDVRALLGSTEPPPNPRVLLPAMVRAANHDKPRLAGLLLRTFPEGLARIAVFAFAKPFLSNLSMAESPARASAVKSTATEELVEQFVALALLRFRQPWRLVLVDNSIPAGTTNLLGLVESHPNASMCFADSADTWTSLTATLLARATPAGHDVVNQEELEANHRESIGRLASASVAHADGIRWLAE